VRAADGSLLASRRKENPALAPALRLGEVLGVDARSNLLTPASRSEESRDRSVGAYFDQRAKLESWKASRTLLPAAKPEEIADAEAVEDEVGEEEDARTDVRDEES
jgi:hypothetical protein